MALIEEGELHLDINGAGEDQLRAGLAAARDSFAQSGVDVRAAFAAQARVAEAEQSELAWEQGQIAEPVEPSAADLALSDAVDAAWMAAVRAAGFDPRADVIIGKFGLSAPEA